MKNLLFPFLCFGICFSQTSAIAHSRVYSDEQALQTIMNSSSESNRYYVKTSSKEIERPYGTNHDQLDSIQKKYPKLEIESANRLFSLDKVLASFPPIPFRMIEAHGRRHPELGKLLDTITADILTTPLGSKICIAATEGYRFQMMAVFNVSASVAERLQKTTCPHSEGFNKRPRHERDALDVVFGEWDYLPNYAFVVFEDDVKLPFESWTATYGRLDSFDNEALLGKTYIHIDPKRFKLSSLYRTIAHEIVMRLDYRSQLPPVDEVESLLDPSSSCLALSTATHPQVRLSMSTVRALQWENQIMKELGFLKPEEADTFAAQSCVSKIKQVIPYTVPFKDLLQEEGQLVKMLLQHRGCAMTHENISLNNLESGLGLRLRDNKGIESSLCESIVNTFSINMHVSNRITFSTYFHPGPRPPVGRGTGSNFIEPSPSSEIAPEGKTPLVIAQVNFDKYNVFTKPLPVPVFPKQEAPKGKPVGRGR